MSPLLQMLRPDACISLRKNFLVSDLFGGGGVNPCFVICTLGNVIKLSMPWLFCKRVYYGNNLLKYSEDWTCVSAAATLDDCSSELSQPHITVTLQRYGRLDFQMQTGRMFVWNVETAQFNLYMQRQEIAQNMKTELWSRYIQLQ